MTARRREAVLTPLDVALLEALDAEPNLVRAARRLGIARDRGVYRLARMGRAAGAPVVRASRGGRAAGTTRLTALGRRLLARGRGGLLLGAARGRGGPLAATLLRGRYEAGPPPRVRFGPVRLHVAFAAADGEAVRVAVDPEAVLVARRRFATSARNVLPATVVRLERADAARIVLTARAGPLTLAAGVTPDAVRALRLAVGGRVVLYVKATAVRRVGGPTRGSPRSRGRRPPPPRGGSASR